MALEYALTFFCLFIQTAGIVLFSYQIITMFGTFCEILNGTNFVFIFICKQLFTIVLCDDLTSYERDVEYKQVNVSCYHFCMTTRHVLLLKECLIFFFYYLMLSVIPFRSTLLQITSFSWAFVYWCI